MLKCFIHYFEKHGRVRADILPLRARAVQSKMAVHFGLGRLITWLMIAFSEQFRGANQLRQAQYYGLLTI